MVNSHAFQKAICDKVSDTLAKDVVGLSHGISLAILQHQGKIVSPSIVTRIILVGVAQLFEDGKIILKEEK